MKKYLLTAGLLCAVSHASAAAAADTVENNSSVSPRGLHGHGYSSKPEFPDAPAVFPVLVTCIAADGKESSRIPIDSAMSVQALKTMIMTVFQLRGGHRFMWGDTEIMTTTVNADGSLAVLADIFSGVIAVPTITIIRDDSRSPMATPAPQPLPESAVSPLKAEPSAL